MALLGLDFRLRRTIRSTEPLANNTFTTTSLPLGTVPPLQRRTRLAGRVLASSPACPRLLARQSQGTPSTMALGTAGGSLCHRRRTHIRRPACLTINHHISARCPPERLQTSPKIAACSPAQQAQCSPMGDASPKVRWSTGGVPGIPARIRSTLNDRPRAV